MSMKINVFIMPFVYNKPSPVNPPKPVVSIAGLAVVNSSGTKTNKQDNKKFQSQ